MKHQLIQTPRCPGIHVCGRERRLMLVEATAGFGQTGGDYGAVISRRKVQRIWRVEDLPAAREARRKRSRKTTRRISKVDAQT